MKSIISLKLKKVRNDLGYSIEYVSEQLKKFGFNISPNTIYNYENGVSQPKADMFLALCKIYNIENFDIFFTEKNIKINKYNFLNFLGKKKADEYIDDLLDNPKYSSTDIQTELPKHIPFANRKSQPQLVAYGKEVETIDK